MRSLLDYLFSEAPWLRPVLAWTLAGLVVILILMLPAYFIFLPVFRRIHAELSRFLKELVQRHATARADRRTRLEKEAEEYQRNAHLKRITIGAYALWNKHRKAVSGILRELKAWRKQLVTAEETLRDVAKALPGLGDKLDGSNVAMPRQLPTLPDTEGLADQTVTVRLARMNLIIGGILLLSIVSVNTGMLSQIIKELGIIPATLRFGPLRIFYIVAFMLTLLEAGLGFVFGASTTRHTSEGVSFWVRVFQVVIVCAALGIACVEGFFYSRVAPTRGDMFTFPIIDYTVSQQNIFFFWGFILVTTLFGLGMICHNSGATVVQGTPLTEIHRQVRRMVELASHWKDLTTKVEGTIMETGAQIRLIDGTLVELLEGSGSTTGQGIKKAMTGVERLETVIIGVSGDAPAWARISKEELTKSEVLQLMHRAGLWLCLSLIASVVMMFVGWKVITHVRPALEIWLGWVLAISQAIAFVGAGFLFGAGEVFVQDGEPPKLITVNPTWSMSMATTLAVLLLAGHFVGLFKLAIPHGQGLLWVCNFLIGTFLLAAGHQLAPLLALAGLWLQRVGHWLVTIAEFIYEMLVRVFFGLGVVIEYVFLIPAFPIEMILRRGRTDPQMIPGKIEGGHP